MGREANTALENVARLEIENAVLRARIDRIRAHDAMEETIRVGRVGRVGRADRDADAGRFALGASIVIMVAGIVMGMLLGITAASLHSSVPISDPAPAIDPMPPTPPVYVVPPPRLGSPVEHVTAVIEPSCGDTYR